MDYRRLGNSGLTVSTVCLGTMMFGGPTPEKESREIVAHALDNGVNFIDTADVYEKGESERITGAAIRDARDAWIVATKVGNAMQPGQRNNGGLSRRWIAAECDASLARMGLDTIDIYYLHLDDHATPLDETVHAIGDLIRAGKIRYFGVSNFRGWRIAEIVHACDRAGVERPIVCQPYYNLLNRMPEVEVLPACDHYGIGVVPYSPIARGVLTGKYAKGSVPPDSRAARNDRRLKETEFREESLAIADTLKAHAENTGRTATQFAVAWVLENRIVSSVIAGPRTFDQWKDYVDAVGRAWTDDDEALVDSLVRPGHPSTPGYTDPRYPFFGRRR
ncbi:MAG TPA: aldo/keto reductase [Casimicrobiaceae bacterium]|nr:aldo/keto reductase [Casimicrobiaceae bacterium]